MMPEWAKLNNRTIRYLVLPALLTVASLLVAYAAAQERDFRAALRTNDKNLAEATVVLRHDLDALAVRQGSSDEQLRQIRMEQLEFYRFMYRLNGDSARALDAKDKADKLRGER